MRIENRLKALEVVTKPERVLVAVGPDETLERAIDRMGLAPGARVIAVHTGVPRSGESRLTSCFGRRSVHVR